MNNTYDPSAYRHSAGPLEKVNVVVLSRKTEEFQLPPQVWKVSRLLETFYVTGFSQTEAYVNAAREADLTIPDFFCVPVFAEKTTEVPDSRQIFDYEV